MKQMIKQLTQKETVLRVAKVAYCYTIFGYFGLNYVLEQGVGISSALSSLLIYALLAYKIILTRYTKKEMVVGVGLFALAGISLYLRKDTTILTNVLVLFSLKDVDIDSLLKPLFWSALAGSILVASCSYVGIGLPMSITKVFREERGIETRYCFGYGHPNPFHMYMVRLMCLFAGAFYRKLDWRHLTGLAIFNLLIFAFSDSRTGMLGGFALILLLLIYRYGGAVINSKTWNVLMAACMVAVIAFGFLSVLLWGKVPGLDVINGFFTRRIEFAYMAWQEVGVSAWGRDLLGNYPCDNGMINMMVTYGWVAAAVYWISTLVLYVKALRERRHYLTIILVIFAVCTVMESAVSEKIFRNIPMMYMSLLIFGDPVLETRSLLIESKEELG